MRPRLGLPQQPVRVVAGTASPWAVGVAEVHADSRGASQVLVPRHLLVLAVGQRLAQRSGDRVELLGERSERWPRGHRRRCPLDPPPDESRHGRHARHETEGNVDKDFALMVRMYHQQAVEMAEIQRRHGKLPELRDMAQQILTSQRKQIAQFDKWLAANK